MEMKRYYVTDYYGNCLDVSTNETDLSQKVKCLDNDTDEIIYINGWDVDWQEWEDDEEWNY